MQTRRDQLHAYRFMTRRAMSALVTGEPDMVEPPMRRLTLMTISGIMVAIVVAAVFAVIGLLRGGGGDDWKAEGSVIVEEETGARFVMMQGKLHPVLNYSSAVLASGASGAVQSVSRDDLASVERGQTVGIPGLPDSMPSAQELVDGPITVCSQPEVEGLDTRAAVKVSIGTDDGTREMAAGEALYVQSFEGERFLLFEGQRHVVEDDVAASLQLTQDPAPVGDAFLSAVPMGAPFETPQIEGAGAAKETPGGVVRVGQLIEADDGSMWVMLADGVAPVTDVQARLLRTMKLDGSRREPLSMSFSDVLDMDEAELDDQMAGLPANMPVLSTQAAETAGACVLFSGDSSTPQFRMPEADAGAGTPTTQSDASSHGSADEVTLRPGSALLASVPGAQAVYVISGPGKAYPASNVGVLSGFGYDEGDLVEVPAELLDIIPRGDAFDAGDARMSAG